eukprot:6263656-Prymnesium_polylepis.1
MASAGWHVMVGASRLDQARSTAPRRSTMPARLPMSRMMRTRMIVFKKDDSVFARRSSASVEADDGQHRSQHPAVRRGA